MKVMVRVTFKIWKAGMTSGLWMKVRVWGLELVVGLGLGLSLGLELGFTSGAT